MKKYIKEFLLSSAFIWVFYYFIVDQVGVTNAKDGLIELLLYSGFLFPIYLLVGGIIPVLYILFILKKEKNKLQKSLVYYCLSWILFLGLVFVTVPVSTWIQNQLFFGGQGEEHKQILLLDAEKSLEEKLNQKFELVKTNYINRGSFDNVAFYLDFQEENCEKDCEFVQVYLSYEEQGWRMKIINGEIWNLKE